MTGVKFGNMHTYKDFGLILNSKTIEAPAPKTASVEIPFADGELDFSEAFGGVKYNNRQLKFAFTHIGAAKEFSAARCALLSAIHGKKMHIIIDDDASYYYIGRCRVDSWSDGKGYADISIVADCEPYKYKLGKTTVAVNLSTNASVVTWNQLNKNDVNSGSRAGFTFEKGTNGKWHIYGTRTSASAAYSNVCYNRDAFFYTAGHKYYFYSGDPSIMICGLRYSTMIGDWAAEHIEEAGAASTYGDVIRLQVDAKANALDVTVTPIVVDLTLMYGAGNEPTSLNDSRLQAIREAGANNPAYNSGTRAVLLPNGDKQVSPRINSNRNATIEFKGTTASVTSGDTVVPEFVLDRGFNVMTFPTAADTATINISYMEGRL